MTQYLGISLVVVVIGLILAVLARLMTGGILDEIEKIRERRFARRMTILMRTAEGFAKYTEKSVKNLRNIIEEEEKSKQKGMTSQEMAEIAKKAVRETLKTE